MCLGNGETGLALQYALKIEETKFALRKRISANIVGLVFARFAMQYTLEMVRLALLFNVPWK